MIYAFIFSLLSFSFCSYPVYALHNILPTKSQDNVQSVCCPVCQKPCGVDAIRFRGVNDITKKSHSCLYHKNCLQEIVLKSSVEGKPFVCLCGSCIKDEELQEVKRQIAYSMQDGNKVPFEKLSKEERKLLDQNYEAFVSELKNMQERHEKAKFLPSFERQVAHGLDPEKMMIDANTMVPLFAGGIALMMVSAVTITALSKTIYYFKLQDIPAKYFSKLISYFK